MVANERTRERLRSGFSEAGKCDPAFLDDLTAAIKLKTSLVGRGVQLDAKILDDLAKFYFQFSKDIKACGAAAVADAANAAATIDAAEVKS